MARYDVVVLGGGPGGYVAAIRAAQLGRRVALVERRDTLGGTCLNVGCIPSKALLDSSEFFERIRDEAAQHGIKTSAPKLDVSGLQARKTAVVDKLTGGVAQLLKAAGVDVIHGHGWIVDAQRVEVRPVDAPEVAERSATAGQAGISARSANVEDTAADAATPAGQMLETEALVIATGSVPVELPDLPFDGRTVVDSTGALAFERVPEKLVVVGAGVIGLELGSVWARLGSKVTVVELLPVVLPGWDAQVQKTMQRELSKQGLTFLLETRVAGVRLAKAKRGRGADGGAHAVLTALDKAGTRHELEADKVLVAVGRRANLHGYNLEALGVRTERGRIVVDERFATSVPGVYAIGDVVAGPMLAHKAEEEGVALAELLAGRAGHVNYETIPNVVYTWPEVASVGKTEAQLTEAGIQFGKGVFPLSLIHI